MLVRCKTLSSVTKKEELEIYKEVPASLLSSLFFQRAILLWKNEAKSTKVSKTTHKVA